MFRDPEILPDRRHHLVNIDLEFLADIPDLVCERYLRGKERVVSVLDHLCGSNIRKRCLAGNFFV